MRGLDQHIQMQLKMRLETLVLQQLEDEVWVSDGNKLWAEIPWGIDEVLT